jgi:predicted MPP superfamily phosphohydrolase
VIVPQTCLPTWERLRASLTRWFFGHFFRLLLLVASVSEWTVLYWLFRRSLGPGIIFAANRWAAVQTQRRRRDRNPAGALPRFYYAFAFTCLFCFSFLLLTATLWMTARVLVGAIAVEARTTQASLVIDAGLDLVFRWFADAGMAVIALALAYGYTIGQRRLRITHLGLQLRNAPESLHGLRIVQISDIHIGQNIGKQHLECFVARVNELHPDLICITGDVIDGPFSDVQSLLPVLGRLRAAHGVFAILGNHDHYAGADRVATALETLTTATVLRDEHLAIRVNGTRLHIVGLDDRGRDWARGVPTSPYLPIALAAIPEEEPVLLLCHRPDLFPQAAAAGVPLMLSGHTHGGQLAVPWFNGRRRNLAEFITAYDRGLFERDGSYLYVNCGLGVTGQRIRLFTPREITVIDVQCPALSRRAA